MRYGVFGQISNQLDIPTLAFWVFALFFVGLVFWLQRESKREGYPLKASPFTTELLDGFPPPPAGELTYILNEGGTTDAPHFYEQPPTHSRPMHQFDGTPFRPLGNPLLAAIGPGSWVMKKDVPALTERGDRLLEPLRAMHEWSIERQDADPRGMAVFDWRWNEVGRVVDVWIDRGIKIIRMLEVELRDDLRAGYVPGSAPRNATDGVLGGAPEGVPGDVPGSVAGHVQGSMPGNVQGSMPGNVLVPIYHTEIREKSRRVRVTSLWAHQFADVPMPATLGEITGQEEERLNAYYSAGFFYRADPLTAPPLGSAP